MKRLKVLFLTAWYPSGENPVAGTFVREHARAVNLYDDVVVLYAHPAPGQQEKVFQVHDSVEHGIRTVRVTYRRPAGVPILPMVLYYLAIMAGWRHIRQNFRPDIIHGHLSVIGIPALKLAARERIPLVFTEHSSGFPGRNLHWYELFSAKIAYPRADLVCPVSQNLAGHIEAYGIKAKFAVVPNAVNVDMFTARLKEPGNPRKLLTVSNLAPLKGIPVMLQALAQVRRHRNDFVLDIVGHGPLRQHYERTAAELGLAGVVRFHGLKPKPEVAEFMSESDLFLLSSHWENLPCALIEAMACGNPVLATAVGGIPEIVSPAQGKLVAPGDADALAVALDEMLNILPSFDRLAIAASARRRYSYEAVGGAYDSSYRTITEKGDVRTVTIVTREGSASQ